MCKTQLKYPSQRAVLNTSVFRAQFDQETNKVLRHLSGAASSLMIQERLSNPDHWTCTDERLLILRFLIGKTKYEEFTYFTVP